MRNVAFQFVVLLGLLPQSAGITPPRLGDVARQLTEQDVAGLEMVLPEGSKPWLLTGESGQIPGPQNIQAYLPPTTSTAILRRGPVIDVTRSGFVNRGNATPPSTAWTVRSTVRYAQVAMTGRSFDQIQGDQDINRPFLVEGSFDDSELVGLVEFLRSNAA